ncbi:MAG: hypothetical protein DRR08_18160 [Candidatus Parabeggiatoa sp. nov. 2]|nr:MAG: hypothetical protein DRR08_18160 [Gammaproteobacteria bacterium]HEC84215.1 hypothetical protein [Thioploca sp.]
MLNKTGVSLLLLTALATAGCATSKKVDIVQPGDHKLSCTELKAELQKLDNAQADVDSNKAVTGTNVAAALFWLPGLAYTYYDAGEASRLIADRKAHITQLYNEKDC